MDTKKELQKTKKEMLEDLITFGRSVVYIPSGTTKLIEEYNPKIHCCRYWYKDFCECVKESMKEAKKKSRDRNVSGTLSFLKKSKIDYIESNIPNVVIINPTTDNVFLSLKKEKNLFKCRFNGSAKWYSFSRQKLIDKFSNERN